MTHPAVQPHLDASAALQDAANKHRNAAEAHEEGVHEEAKEHAQAARQATLEAAIKSESAAQLSTAPPASRPRKEAPEK
jgi:hypothetical protein